MGRRRAKLRTVGVPTSFVGDVTWVVEGTDLNDVTSKLE